MRVFWGFNTLWYKAVFPIHFYLCGEQLLDPTDIHSLSRAWQRSALNKPSNYTQTWRGKQGFVSFWASPVTKPPLKLKLNHCLTTTKLVHFSYQKELLHPQRTRCTLCKAIKASTTSQIAAFACVGLMRAPSIMCPGWMTTNTVFFYQSMCEYFRHNDRDLDFYLGWRSSWFWSWVNIMSSACVKQGAALTISQHTA